MTSATQVLRTAFDNIAQTVQATLDGLDPEQLQWRPEGGDNSIAWLVWHLTRVQDDHVADVAGQPQVWPGSWAERFGLPFDVAETGYAMNADDVARVRGVPAADLLGYHQAVHGATDGCLAGLADDELDRVVDESWDPPVTLAVRLVSVVTDDLQHVGQAAYLRGLQPSR